MIRNPALPLFSLLLLFQSLSLHGAVWALAPEGGHTARHIYRYHSVPVGNAVGGEEALQIVGIPARGDAVAAAEDDHAAGRGQADGDEERQEEKDGNPPNLNLHVPILVPPPAGGKARPR